MSPLFWSLPSRASAYLSPMRNFCSTIRGFSYADAIVHFALGPYAAASFAVGFAAYSEILPQSTAVAFILEKVAVNGIVMWCHSMMVWWQDRSWMWYRSSWVSCVSRRVIFLVGKAVCCCIPNFSVMESLPFKSESAGLYLSLFNRYKDI